MTLEVAQQPLEPGHIWIGQTSGTGHKFKLKGPITRAKATVPADAIRTGQPTFADDQYASSVIWEDMTGGLGVINMDEKESPDRFSDSNAWTLTKNLVTLPPRVRSPGGSTSVATMNGHVVGACTHGGYTYIVGGTAVGRFSGGSSPTGQHYDTGTSSWVTSGGTQYYFSSTAYSDPIHWKGNIWFPCTDRLYRYNVSAATFSEVTNASGAASIAALYLCVFDEDLVILTSSGTVYSTDDNATSVTLTNRGAIETFERLNGMVVDRNLAGDPAIFITTESGLKTLDYWTQKVYDAGVSFMDGRFTSGMGLTVWDGSKFFGKESNVHEVTNGARVVRGPNTGDGLVSSRQGFVTALDPSMSNNLLAAVSNLGSGSVGAALMAYNRRGWHNIVQWDAGRASVSGTDSFTGADSAVTMGGAWNALNGTWGISSNKAYNPAGAGVPVVVRSATNFGPDIETQVTFSTIAAAGIRLVFRCNDATNYWAVESTSAGYDLVTVVAGVKSVKKSYACTATSGDVLKVTAFRDIITVSLNGGEIIRHLSTTFMTAGNHGIGATAVNSSHRWDDYSLYQYSNISFVHYVGSSNPSYPGTLYFNDGPAVAYVRLFDTTDNPFQFLASDFDTAGSVTLPKFDADLANLQKNAVSVELRTLGCSATETVTVSYATDDSDSYTQMYTSAGAQTAVTSNGLTTLYFDTNQLGTLFYNVRLKLTLASGSATAAPKVVFAKIRYERIFDTLYSYAGVVDFENGDMDGHLSASALAAWDALVESKQLVRFAYQSGHATSGDSNTRVGRIRVSGGQTGLGGTDRGGFAQFTILEITPQ